MNNRRIRSWRKNKDKDENISILVSMRGYGELNRHGGDKGENIIWGTEVLF